MTMFFTRALVSRMTTSGSRTSLLAKQGASNDFSTSPSAGAVSRETTGALLSAGMWTKEKGGAPGMVA